MDDVPSDGEPGGVGHHRLENVLGLGSSVLRTALEGAGSDIEFDQLEGVFESAQHAMVVSSTGSAQAAPSSNRAPQPAAREPAGRGEMRAEHVALRIAEFEKDAQAVFDLEDLGVSQEQLSIFLQMLHAASNGEVTVALVARLGNIRIDDRAQAVEICERALIDLAEKLPFESFDLVFPVLGKILRLDVRAPLVERLPQLAQACSDRTKEALWPHAADELLRHRRGEGRALAAGPLRFLDELPQHAMPRAVERLCKLPALSQNKLAGDAFDVRQPRCYRLFAYLANSSRAELVGPQILTALPSLAVEFPGASSLIKAIERYRPEYAEFFHHLLLALSNGTTSDELSMHTSVLLSRALRRIDPIRRKELWVPAAIAFLGEEGSPSARPILQNIVGQRRWVGVFTWPTACRKEAARALDRLRESEQPDGS